MRGQEDGLAETGKTLDRFPRAAAGAWVESRRGLVKEKNTGISGQGDSHVKAALLAA
jgi:hypothetical protein